MVSWAAAQDTRHSIVKSDASVVSNLASNKRINQPWLMLRNRAKNPGFWQKRGFSEAALHYSTPFR